MTKRFIYALLTALLLTTAIAGSAFAHPAAGASAQRTQTERVRVYTLSGAILSGIHVIPDDYVLVCPTEEVLDPKHPCFEGNNAAAVDYNIIDDYVLVCPSGDLPVASPDDHPCNQRVRRMSEAERAEAYVMFCPAEYTDEDGQCSGGTSAAVANGYHIFNDYVTTCPHLTELNTCTASW